MRSKRALGCSPSRGSRLGEDGPGAPRIWRKVPGTGGVGFGDDLRLGALGEPGEEVRGEGVCWKGLTRRSDGWTDRCYDPSWCS